MFCTQCGKQLDENVTFCIYCGAKIEPLDGGPAPMEAAPYQPQMTETAPYQPQMTETAPYQPQMTETAPYQPQMTETAPYQPQMAETASYQPQMAEPTAYQPQATEPAAYQPQVTVNQQNPPDSPAPSGKVKTTKKKKSPAKVIIPIVLAVIILAGAAVAYMLYNSPAARMDRALEAGDLEQAYDIFENELQPGDVSDHSIELLKEAAAKTRDDYLAGSITYEEALEELRYIGRFECEKVSEALSAAMDSVQTHYYILTQLDAAESYYQNGDYAAAISAYEDILELDPSNENAASGLDLAKAAYYEDQFAQAEKLVAQGDYEAAIRIYQDVLSEDPSNTAATDGLEAAKDAYRDKIITVADGLAAKGDFDGAVRTIAAAMTGYFEDDEKLAKAIEDLHDREIKQMTDDVYGAADGGDWDGALDLLDEYQGRYPAEKALQEVREEILRKMPITLKNLTMVNYSSIEILTSVVSDRWGNVYDGAVRYNASNHAFGLYNLDKRYVTFTGTIFAPTNATNGKNMSVAVYLDEELVYYVDNITEETAPIPLEINVAGATTMRIVTDNIGTSSYGHLYFANTRFTKVTDTTEE